MSTDWRIQVNGMYALCRAEVVDVGGKNRRCDNGRMGPVGVHRWIETENRCECGRTEPLNKYTNDHFVTLADVHGFRTVIAALPYGFVMFLELKADEMEQRLLLEPNHVRSLQELLRYFVEWDWAYGLGSREAAAELCHGMLSVMEMPSGVYDWVVSEVPFGRLGRFLSGHTDAAARTTDAIPPLTTEAQEWLENLMRREWDDTGN